MEKGLKLGLIIGGGVLLVAGGVFAIIKLSKKDDTTDGGNDGKAGGDDSKNSNNGSSSNGSNSGNDGKGSETKQTEKPNGEHVKFLVDKLGKNEIVLFMESYEKMKNVSENPYSLAFNTIVPSLTNKLIKLSQKGDVKALQTFREIKDKLTYADWESAYNKVK